jgi:protein gp37
MLLAGTRMQHHPSRAGLTHVVNGNHVWTGEVRFNDGTDGKPDWLDQPLSWTKPRAIFVNAHGDTFHENVPDAWIDQIMARAALCPQHVFQVLTKRAGRQRDYMADPATPRRIMDAVQEWGGTSDKDARRRFKACEALRDWPLANVWNGVSVEDQANARRLAALRDTPTRVPWVSAEPLLGPLDLTPWLDFLRWVVVGGESDKGPRARPMHPDWPRQLRDDCFAADVPFHFKQHGDWIGVSDLSLLDGGHGPGFGAYDHCRYDKDAEAVHVGKAVAGRLLDGATHDGVPA